MAERLFPDEGIEVLSHSIEFTKVREGAAAIRGEASPCMENQFLKENLKDSFRYHQRMLEGAYPTVKEMAEVLDLDYHHLRKVMALRFLAGDILQKILTDKVPTHWTIGRNRGKSWNTNPRAGDFSLAESCRKRGKEIFLKKLQKIVPRRLSPTLREFIMEV